MKYMLVLMFALAVVFSVISAQESKSTGWFSLELEPIGSSFATGTADPAIIADKIPYFFGNGTVSYGTVSYEGSFRMRSEQSLFQMLGVKAWLWKTLAVGARLEKRGYELQSVETGPGDFFDGFTYNNLKAFGGIFCYPAAGVSQGSGVGLDHDERVFGVVQNAGKKKNLFLRYFIEAKTPAIDFDGLCLELFAGYEPWLDKIIVSADDGTMRNGDFVIKERQEMGTLKMFGRCYGGLGIRFSSNTSGGVAVFRLFVSEPLQERTLTPLGRAFNLKMSAMPMLSGFSIGFLL